MAGRPRKPENEKLVNVAASIPQDMLILLEALKTPGESTSAVIRRLIHQATTSNH